jgi:hypothetical protein
MSGVDVHGPIDFILIEFEGDGPRTDSVAALIDLVDAGIVRLYDLVAIRKELDGSVAAVELVEAAALSAFEALTGARSGLLSADDVAEAGESMTPGTTAVLIVYENAWAIPFIAAALREGGSPVASARIPAVDVMAALDALES